VQIQNQEQQQSDRQDEGFDENADKLVRDGLLTGKSEKQPTQHLWDAREVRPDNTEEGNQQTSQMENLEETPEGQAEAPTGHRIIRLNSEQVSVSEGPYGFFIK